MLIRESSKIKSNQFSGKSKISSLEPVSSFMVISADLSGTPKSTTKYPVLSDIPELKSYLAVRVRVLSPKSGVTAIGMFTAGLSDVAGLRM